MKKASLSFCLIIGMTAVLPFGGTNLLDGKNYKTGDTLILAGKDAAIVKLQ